MAISGISGTLTHGSSVTISGSGFGTKSLAGPMVYDDFATGTNGNIIAGPDGGVEPLIHQGAFASYTEWVRDGGGEYLNESLLYSNNSPKTHSTMHARAIFTNSGMWGLDLYLPYFGFTTGNKLYFSYYYRMSKIGAVPFPRQSKSWIAYNGSWADRAYWSTAYDNCEAGGWRQHLSQVDENNWSLTGQSIEAEWVRFDTYVKQSAANSATGIWRQTAHRPSLGTPAKESADWRDVVMRTTTDDWTQWVFGGAYYSMCNSGDNANIDVTNFYFDNTPQRVEIGNASTWAACTKSELQRATAWADGSITVVLDHGYFGATDTAWLYVFDNDDAVLFSANGFQVTLGGGGGLENPGRYKPAPFRMAGLMR